MLVVVTVVVVRMPGEERGEQAAWREVRLPVACAHLA